MLDIFVYILLVVLIYLWFKKRRAEPPGPYGLPIFGYYPFLGNDPIKTIHELSQRYGDIMSINLLGETFWVLNSYEAIKEAFVTKGDIFAARPADEYGIFQELGKGTVVLSEGDEWRAETKFMLGHMAQLGMGKSEFEVTIHSILDDLDKYIDSKSGEAHDYSDIVHNYACNVMCEMICRKRFEVDNPTYVSLQKWEAAMFTAFGYMNMIVSGDVFRLLMKCNPVYETTGKLNQDKIVKFAAELIDERVKSFDANHCYDLLDYYLKESSGSNGKYFKPEGLPRKVASMIIASDTPASVLYHCLFLIAANPDIQQRAFDEIDNSIGTERHVGYLERDRLPYTQAVIAEVLRFIQFAPLGNTHVNRVPTELLGYNVPKRQKVLANIYTLSRDPKYFVNPNEFDPKNFLGENGYYKPIPASIPFGVGVRKCLGMKLAEVEIFIAFVRFIQKFEWKLHESASRSVTEGNMHHLHSFKVHATRRK